LASHTKDGFGIGGSLLPPTEPPADHIVMAARIQMAQDAYDCSVNPIDQQEALHEVLEILGLLPNQPPPRDTVKWSKIKRPHGS